MRDSAGSRGKSVRFHRIPSIFILSFFVRYSIRAKRESILPLPREITIPLNARDGHPVIRTLSSRALSLEREPISVTIDPR